MKKPARRFPLLSVFLAAAVLCTASLAPAVQARAQSLYAQPKYAAIVVDAGSGEVLYARRADQPRYPASITKVMTLYLVFEALQTGRLKLDDQVTVSAFAAGQPPSKSGLRPGQSLSVDEAIRVTALKSANDIAVALAEKVGGNESRFAALMTLRAQELGMTNTRFVNANGLPDPRHVTTARDIAILSRAVMRDYPQYYAFFSQKTYNFRGQTITNHNRLLARMPGMDGLKTGYTAAAGFTLAASAVRDGRRLITVVLGGASTAARDENVEDLLNAGFDVLTKRKAGQTITIAANMREPDDVSGPIARPATEMGSGEQAGLRVVVADAGGSAPIPTSIDSWLNQPGGGAAANFGEGGLKAATLALASTDRDGAAECAKVSTRTKVKAGRHHRTRTVVRTRTVCKAGAEPTVRVAKAQAADCEKVAVRGRTAKARRIAARKAAAACKAETQVASKADKGSRETATSDAAGSYRIQVGAFDSRSAAEQHITKLSRRYASVASAASQVQAAGRGAYRARFNGFSAQGAKAACAALSSKGERCMVIAPS